MEDMDRMSIGTCMDYVEEWIEKNADSDDNGQSTVVREATQADFDAF